MKTILPFVPIVVVLVAAIARHLIFVRFIAIIVILLCALVAFPIAPHRVAEELVHGSPQSAEWQRGARDTRDAVYAALPVLAASLLMLAVLAAVPLRRKSN